MTRTWRLRDGHVLEVGLRSAAPVLGLPRRPGYWGAARTHGAAGEPVTVWATGLRLWETRRKLLRKLVAARTTEVKQQATKPKGGHH